jgi:hypothetical protein
MYAPIEGLLGGVIGFEAVGRLEPSDYDDALMLR